MVVGHGVTPGTGRDADGEVYRSNGRTVNDRPGYPSSSARTRRSRTMVDAVTGRPIASASAPTTSSGRPVPSDGWKRVRARIVERRGAGHLDGDEQRPQVVVDGTATLLAAARQGRRVEHGQRSGRHAGARDTFTDFECDAVIGGSHGAGEGRPAQPDVTEIGQAPAGRDMRLERLADTPSGPALREQHVDELGLGRHADRQWRAEREPGPRRVSGSGHDRQPGRLDPRAPGVRDVALRERRRLRTAPDDQPPALPWLDHDRTRRCGIGLHVC